jgi:hypothetical protein
VTRSCQCLCFSCAAFFQKKDLVINTLGATQGKTAKDEDPEIINKILNDTETQKMFKHIIPLTNRNIEELQKACRKMEVIDLRYRTSNFHWRQSVSYKQ